MSNISKEQHPSPIESDGKPLHGDVDERHGNSQSKDDPGGAERPFLSSWQDTEHQKPKLCMKNNRRKSGTIRATAVGSHLLPEKPLELSPSEQPGANAAACSLWVHWERQEKLWRCPAPSVEERDSEKIIPVPPATGSAWEQQPPPPGYSLLQQDGSACHQCDASPVPDHDN